jgi:hypothetical protein
VVSGAVLSATQARIALSSTGSGSLVVNWWAVGE